MQPLFNPKPESRSPTETKEQVTMGLIIFMAENTRGIRLEKMKPISCTKPTQNRQPQNEAVSRQGPWLPDDFSPTHWSAAKPQEFIGVGCEWTCRTAPLFHQRERRSLATTQLKEIISKVDDGFPKRWGARMSGSVPNGVRTISYGVSW
jgi:hypothetical protein